ncbi:MAG: putative sporulation protein YtxC [Bacillota bacterium]
MSPLISIGSSENIDFIREKLETKLEPLLFEDVILTVDESNTGEYFFWDLNVFDLKESLGAKEGTAFIVKYLMAELVAEIIVEKIEVQLLANLIGTYYLAFSPEEQQGILEKATNYLKANPNQKRKKTILQLVLDYLETDKLLIFDGFVRFRLKNYIEELGGIAEWAIDEYLMEKEYNDFIGLLKYFVDIQEPKVEVVHVLIEKDKTFRLYDDLGNLINNDYLENFIIEIGDNELNYEDLLISTLITIAPKKIVVHSAENKSADGIIKTIDKVFTDRVSRCFGCNKCLGKNDKHIERP